MVSGVMDFVFIVVLCISNVVVNFSSSLKKLIIVVSVIRFRIVCF